MAIPIIVPIVLVAALAAGASAKPRRRRGSVSPQPDNGGGPPLPGPAKPLPCWRREPTDEAPFGFVEDGAGNCVAGERPVVFGPDGWELPPNWFAYRTPLAREVAFSEPTNPLPPLQVAYVLLLAELTDQLGQDEAVAMMPRNDEPPGGGFWQTDVPNRDDYYNGPDEILALMYHLADFVNGAYGRWEGGDDFYLSPEG